MKAKERHHLKQNEFAVTAARVLDTLSQHQRRVRIILLAVLAVVAVTAAVVFWRGREADRAGEQLGIALAMLDATIAPAPTIPGARQASGTFPSERARAEAALAAFQRVAAEFSGTEAGLAARYHAAGELLSLGRSSEAAQMFEEVVDQAGASSIYKPMARMGLAEANPKEYKELARWQSPLKGPCWTGPVLSNGILYIRGPEQMLAIDMKAQ